MGPQILLVEDDESIVRMLRMYIPREGYGLSFAATIAETQDQFSRLPPDLVLLDLSLLEQGRQQTEVEGFEIIRWIRERASTPIVVISALKNADDKIKALRLGADDYVTKPIHTGELMARIDATLRRAATKVEPVATTLKVGDLEVDLSARRVVVAGREVKLRNLEFAVLKSLAEHPDCVLTYGQLLKLNWGPEYGDGDRSLVHVTVSTLRQKIEEDPRSPRWLVAEARVGYKLCSASASASAAAAN